MLVDEWLDCWMDNCRARCIQNMIVPVTPQSTETMMPSNTITPINAPLDIGESGSPKQTAHAWADVVVNRQNTTITEKKRHVRG